MQRIKEMQAEKFPICNRYKLKTDKLTGDASLQRGACLTVLLKVDGEEEPAGVPV